MLLASLQNVAKHYGAQIVLQGVSFKVSSGQKLGLIGPNGSGTTTKSLPYLPTAAATSVSYYWSREAWRKNDRTFQ